MTACRCWDNNHALGHGGHCCFTENGRWRADDEVCHMPDSLQGDTQ